MAHESRACFACGEVNSPDSRFCKHCGRQLVVEREPPTVVRDPRNRLMLALVLILLLACMAFGILGLVSSKLMQKPVGPSAAAPRLIASTGTL